MAQTCMSKAVARRAALADVTESQNAQRLARQFRPERRRGRTDGPLTFPFTLTHLGVEASNDRVSAIIAPMMYSRCRPRDRSIREIRARPERAAIDPIEACARHLHQPKPRCSPGHEGREPHRDQHIDIGEARMMPASSSTTTSHGRDSRARTGSASCAANAPARRPSSLNPALSTRWLPKAPRVATGLSRRQCHPATTCRVVGRIGQCRALALTGRSGPRSTTAPRKPLDAAAASSRRSVAVA